MEIFKNVILKSNKWIYTGEREWVKIRKHFKMPNIGEVWKKNLSGMKDRLKVHISIPKENIKNKTKMGARENPRGKEFLHSMVSRLSAKYEK